MLAWWWWRYNVRWGRVSALRFHLCNLPSIVQVYYQLFNYSDDIYQGQLHRAVSCRENGQSVLLLHSHAGECAAEAVQVGPQEPLAGPLSSEGVSPLLSRVTINHPLWFLTRFSAVFISFGCHSSPIKRSLHLLSFLLYAFPLNGIAHPDPWSSKFLKALDAPQHHRKRAALMHPCSSVRGKRLNLSLFAPHHLHAVQMDAKKTIMESKDLVSSLCLRHHFDVQHRLTGQTPHDSSRSRSLSPAHLSQSAHHAEATKTSKPWVHAIAGK